MKTKKLELNQKEINILINGIYKMFDDEKLENNPNSTAALLMDKLFDAKGWIKSDIKSILHK